MKKTYAGAISNAGNQVVKAPISNTQKSSTKVVKGGDLRSRSPKK